MAQYDYEDRVPTEAEEAEVSRLRDEFIEVSAHSEAIDGAADEGYHWESLVVGWALAKGASLQVAVWLGIRRLF